MSDEPKIPRRDKEEQRKRDATIAKVRPPRMRKGMTVTAIYSEGFPLDTPRKTAINLATQHALEQGIEGVVIEWQILQTPEHEANNEFVVKLWFSTDTEPTGDPNQSPKESDSGAR